MPRAFWVILVLILGAAAGVALISFSRIVVRASPREQLVADHPLDYWIKCLDSGNADLRASAVANLPKFGVLAADPLVLRLDDDSPDIATASILCLGRIGPAAQPALTNAIRPDATPFRRTRAIALLKRMGAAASAPAATRIASEIGDKNVGDAAADYFGACPANIDADVITIALRALPLGDANDYSPAGKVMITAWRDARLRGMATSVLIRTARSSDDPSVRGVAWMELARWAPITPDALQLFAESLGDPIVGADVREAIGKTWSAQTLLALARVANRRTFSEPTRVAAIWSLHDSIVHHGMITDDASVAEVRSLIAQLRQDPSEGVRRACEKSLVLLIGKAFPAE